MNADYNSQEAVKRVAANKIFLDRGLQEEHNMVDWSFDEIIKECSATLVKAFLLHETGHIRTIEWVLKVRDKVMTFPMSTSISYRHCAEVKDVPFTELDLGTVVDISPVKMSIFPTDGGGLYLEPVPNKYPSNYVYKHSDTEGYYLEKA